MAAEPDSSAARLALGQLYLYLEFLQMAEPEIIRRALILGLRAFTPTPVGRSFIRREALRFDPSFLPARLAFAKSFILANQSQVALSLLNEAPESQKKNIGAIVWRNWALLQAGDTKELRSVLNDTLRAATSLELVLQDGLLRMEEKDYAGARADAEKCSSTLLTGHPGNVPALLLLAGRAVELPPDDTAVQDTLGWAYYRKGLFDAVVDHLKLAVDRVPLPAASTILR